MNFQENELIDFFKGIFTEEQEIEETRRGIADDLKSWSEAHEANPKVVKAAYNYYKKLASGKDRTDEIEATEELKGIVYKYLSVEV